LALSLRLEGIGRKECGLEFGSLLGMADDSHLAQCLFPLSLDTGELR